MGVSWFCLPSYYHTPLMSNRVQQLILEAKEGKDMISASSVMQMWRMIQIIDNISSIVPPAEVDFVYQGCQVRVEMRRN